jgi:hypothetical protein
MKPLAQTPVPPPPILPPKQNKKILEQCYIRVLTIKVIK